MTFEHPGDPRLIEAAESEETEIFERGAAERGPVEVVLRGDQDDPREEEGWAQPESSAQKGVVRDEG